MEVVKEISGTMKKQMRITLVKGGDGKFYKVESIQLYDFETQPEFPNFEVVVIQTDANGEFTELVVVHLRRFFKREDTEKNHEHVVKNLDAVLKLQAAKEEHKAH